MRYFIRSVKYFIYFVLIFIVMMAVLVFIGAADGNISTMFRGGYSALWKIALMFAVISAIYPSVGFIRKEVLLPGSWEEDKGTIRDFMEKRGYVLESEGTGTMSFRKTGSGKFTRMYEDNDSYIQRYGGILVNVASTDGVYQILSLLANCYQDNSDLSTTPHRSLEWFLQNDFDYILDLEVYTGFKPSDTTDEPFFTQQEYNDRFENSVEYFRGTSAYENGNVITASYNLYGGYSSFAALKIIASMLYPDLFTLEEGQADLQYWYDNFTTADIDVTVDGGYIYTGDWPN